MDQNHDDDQRKAGDAAVENDVGWSPSDSSNSIRDSPCSVDESPSVSPQAGNNDNDEKEMRKSNVSDLVAKSKKAAASLWTLLHAKVGSGHSRYRMTTKRQPLSISLIILRMVEVYNFSYLPCLLSPRNRTAEWA